MLGSKSMFILTFNIINHPFTKLAIITKIKTQNLEIFFILYIKFIGKKSKQK